MSNFRTGVSILGQDNKIDLVNKLITKGVDWIHYDVMDGIFVKRHSLPIEQVEDIVSKTDIHVVDIHLMVNSPEQYIQRSKHIGDYLTFHYESESIDRIRKIFKNYGFDNKIGIAINPKTNIEQIYEFIDCSSHVLIMSVVPGRGGQLFIPETLDKIKKIKKYISERKLNTKIQVDGGINEETGPLALAEGADWLVSGSYLLKNIDDDLIGKMNWNKIKQKT